jgi:hypothetical protein
MRNLLVLMPFAILASCAAAPSDTAMKMKATEEARLAKALEGLTPGKPLTCVTLRDMRGTESYGDGKLVFRVSRNLVYVNDVKGSCSRVGKGDALITRTYTSQLCRGDIAQAADLVAGFQTDTCVMGEFVPYKKAG